MPHAPLSASLTRSTASTLQEPVRLAAGAPAPCDSSAGIVAWDGAVDFEAVFDLPAERHLARQAYTKVQQMLGAAGVAERFEPARAGDASG